MTQALMDENLDELIKEHVEGLYPVEVIVDNENSRGLFKFTSAFPPFHGTVIRFDSAFYDHLSNNLSFGFEIIENPKGIAKENRDLQFILFKIISFIFELECRILLQKNKNT